MIIEWLGRSDLEAYLIFVTGTTSGAFGEKFAMWRNSLHEKLPVEKMANMEKNLSCGEKWRKFAIWRNFST